MQHHKQVVVAGAQGTQTIPNYHSGNCFTEQFSREIAYVFSCGVLPGTERNSPVSSQNISFHSKSNGGLIEYSATNVVAEGCLSSPHIVAEAYINGGEQDVKDGVGPIIRGQEQPKQIQEHAGSHSH